MAAWVLWLIAAVLFAIGEMMTLGFFLAPFAGGAAVAALLAGVGAGGVVEWAVFLVVSILLLGVVRPIARSHRQRPAQIRTGTAALVGQSGMVLERIANREGMGCVKIEGEVWTARAYDESETIEVGTPVHVVQIRGATALVSE
jgi:membrane protein implicated in regulation of membrane protease activity